MMTTPPTPASPQPSNSHHRITLCVVAGSGGTHASTMRVLRKTPALVLLCALVFLVACSPPPQPQPETTPESVPVEQPPTNTELVTVDGEAITESQVLTRIAQDRATVPGSSDDAVWEQWLTAHDYTVESYRVVTIDRLIDELLINRLARENGIVITNEALDEAIAPIRDGYASDEEWTATLEQLGYTEESYREETRLGLLYQALGDVVDDAIPELASEPAPQAKVIAYLRTVRAQAQITWLF